jgi:hypothetical protein
MSNAHEYILLFMLLMGMYYLAVLLAGWMFKRAILEVMERFRQHSASSRTGAKSIEQLGLQPLNIFERILRVRRDYKPQALQFLIQQEIIDVTPDNRLYLTQEKHEDFKSRMR